MRKPDGYWNAKTVRRELLAFIRKHGLSGVMPTAKQLRDAGRVDLIGGINRNGGFATAREQLGLTTVVPKKEFGYWHNWANVADELIRAMKLLKLTRLPTRTELKANSMNSLSDAVTRFGGSRKVAKKLGVGLSSSRRIDGYWDDLRNLDKELKRYCVKFGTVGVMPVADDLYANGYGALVRGIQAHGGFPKVAKLLGLSRIADRKLHGHWKDPNNVQIGLQKASEKLGTPGVMPSIKQLRDLGESGLLDAVHENGGIIAVSEKFNMRRVQTGKERDYWTLENLHKELEQFNKDRNREGVMPSAPELHKAGRRDIANAIYKHGGYPLLAGTFKMRRVKDMQPQGHWSKIANVHAAIDAFNVEHGSPGVMPASKLLKEHGLHGLVTAIHQHGGFAVVSEQLGYRRVLSRKEKGYWTIESVRAELEEYQKEKGLIGIMPTDSRLLEDGRNDLSGAIARLGGLLALAELFGWDLSYDNKPDGFWTEENLVEELLRFVEEHGVRGVMPKDAELRKAGRNDILKAINAHGGMFVIARKSGLFYSSQLRLTPRTVAEVARIARAIQPLAESNLLSAPQVFVVLRRAGLLELRSSKVKELSISLAGGNHEKIEHCISELIVGSQNDSIESVQVDTDLTVGELEDLKLETRVPSESRLIGEVAPDEYREQEIIRGLSALGELRLPLDQVLLLLSCKLLWEAFYKRIYRWYGSLDVAKLLTESDVKAAILDAYPDCENNEFVRNAASAFAQEVRDAVNFAVHLNTLGWQGPKLHLHQCDAARRMSEIMVGTSDRLFLLEADDPGMGKSASFLAAACVAGLKRVVIVAPKTVADDTWFGSDGELINCLPNARKVRGWKQFLDDRAARHKQTFFVVHYEELVSGKIPKVLPMIDCLCIDEVHFVKQRSGQESTRRRGSLNRLRSAAKSCIGLSGTPLVNELAEPISIMQLLSDNAPQFDSSRLSAFKMNDIADVFESLIPHVIRRTKAEVLLHLPGCDVQLVDVPLLGELENRFLEVLSLPKSKAGDKLVQLRKLSTLAKLPHLLKRAAEGGKLLILTYLTDEISCASGSPRRWQFCVAVVC